MEEERKQKTGSNGEDAAGKTAAESAAGAEGTTSTSTGTSTGTRTGTRTGRRTAATATEEKQGEKPVELSEVEKPVSEKPADVPVILPSMSDEEKKKEQARIRAKKARERKKAEKAAAAAAESKQTFNADQLTVLVVTLSSVLAARPNCQHWQLSQAEAKQIVEPICNIVKANTKIEDLGKYADQIALVIACVTIILPRAIISIQQMNAQRTKKKEVMQNVKAGAITERDAADDRKHNEGQYDHSADAAGVLADLATAGY